MEIFAIGIIAFFTAILTFFSGFGLGTILAPVFAIFFPVDVAIALTGIVHFANNIFKLGLIGKKANKQVLIKFGIPAFVFSFLGAWVLIKIADIPVIHKYVLFSQVHEITIIKLVIAFLLIFFALFEVLPTAQRFQFKSKSMLLGGLLSGFFGGLSGLQGAIRSAFLVKSGLSKEEYIATGVFIACLVDISRLSVYFSSFHAEIIRDNITVLLVACLSAISGAILGRKLLKKVNFRSVQIMVAIMLILISLALGAGLI